MKTLTSFVIAFLFISIMAPVAICKEMAISEQVDAELLFTTALERYAARDYETSLDAIRSSISLDSENKEKKKFAVKLLLEMATRAHLEKRYAKAMKLLEEAVSINPNNKQVNRLYQMNRKRLATNVKASPSSAFGEGLPWEMTYKAGGREKTQAISRTREQSAPRQSRKAGRRPKPGVSLDSAGIIWKFAIMAMVLIFIFVGAVFIYLRQTQARLLKDSFMDIQEVRKGLKEEKMQIKEDRERMEKALKEQAMREKEDMDVRERKRQEVWEREKKERLELELRRKREFDRPVEKGDIIKKKPSEEFLVEDAREAARELDYKNLVARLSAFKRLAFQLKNIYELDKEKAADFIRPLLEDPNPQIRIYLAGGLSHLPIPGFVSILFQLWKDSDVNVRGEALRGIHNFYKRSDFTSVFPEHLQVQIRQIIEQEKRQGEWAL